MDVVVRGPNVPSNLRAAAERKLGRLERLVHDVAWAEVDFSEERNPRIARRHRCAVVVHRRRALVTAHAAAPAPRPPSTSRSTSCATRSTGARSTAKRRGGPAASGR
jgi:hypothetical protein